MKVGIISASLPMELRAALKKAKELGAHGVQLWVAHNELDPRNLSASGREDVVTYMASLGLERSALCGDIGGFADPATVDERIAHTKEMFDLCVDLRTPILTTHIGVVPEDQASSAYGALVDAVREVAEYAAARDCCFATETGPESGAALAAFLRSVNSGGARVNYDPANLCMAGFDPIGDVYALREFIVHTHAKDGLAPSRPDGRRETPLGQGDVDFARYTAALGDIRYSGYLTIERECGDDPVKDIAEAVAFLKGLEGVDP
ncbi:MAG TPA: sugar phosphate isomerase/epimerase family protein [Candidatus Hydrogenedentes bacterium]|nr:sugar phosphate isomerase/epimerase family protein [Candidatus Hydrogenedentota bacterium]HPG68973.1 sugar phosphate isomerase/epimerase family protein [Candidatus Hydrogenedentota bacterium]